MELLKQNNKKLKKDIREVGCFFRSALALSEIKENKKLNAEQINVYWDLARKANFIDKDRCVTTSAPIATLASDLGRWIEIGTFKDGVKTLYKWVTCDLARVDGLIQKIQTDTIFKTHFRVVDNEGKVLFDPYEPSIKPKKIEYSILYHYVEN
jgi:hypothetical protein